MVIHAPRMACRPDIGVESGCQLVPEPSRLMEYGPSRPIMASAPASGSEGCAAAAGAHPSEPDAGALAMMGLEGPYSMSREGSGTSWQPDSTPISGLHAMRGAWMTMVHGQADLVYDDQGGP